MICSGPTHYSCEGFTSVDPMTTILCKEPQTNHKVATLWPTVTCPQCLKLKGRECNFKNPSQVPQQILDDASHEVLSLLYEQEERRAIMEEPK